MAEKTFFRGFVPRMIKSKENQKSDYHLNYLKKLIFMINEKL